MFSFTKVFYLSGCFDKFNNLVNTHAAAEEQKSKIDDGGNIENMSQNYADAVFLHEADSQENQCNAGQCVAEGYESKGEH